MEDKHILSELAALLKSRPEDVSRIEGTRSIAEAAEAIARLAAENGLPVSAAEIIGHYRVVMAARQNAVISDDDLEEISGGRKVLSDAFWRDVLMEK